jgi:hypothetical protein
MDATIFLFEISSGKLRKVLNTFEESRQFIFWNVPQFEFG